MDTSPEKPEYFANGDFEDAVSSIIASPRKGRTINGVPSAVAARMYEMSDKQRDYYKKCFGQLMKSIQGSIDYESAIWGGDTHVVSFFRKSHLENEMLSRVWQMADVNADGWLDLAEFSVAMHLIVLHVKGNLEVPDCLPTHLRPPLTCPRSPPPTPTWSNFDESSSSSTATVVHSHCPSSSIVSVSFHAPPPPHSQSAEALHMQQKIDTPVVHFSDVPPLLVDGRPTAIKTSQPIITAPTPVNTNRMDTAALLLSLKTPMGPPPQPPPRPSNRGHGRSASLDLKTMSTVPAHCRTFPTSSLTSPDCPPSPSYPFTSIHNQPSSSSSFRPMSSSFHSVPSTQPPMGTTVGPMVPARPSKSSTALTTQTSSISATSAPTTTPPNVSTATTVASTTVQAAPTVAVPAGSVTSSSSASSGSSTIVSPPVAPRRTISTNTTATVSTQTEVPYTSRDDLEKFIKTFFAAREDLLGPSVLSQFIEDDGKSAAEKWAARCDVLRRQNAELEKERALLAQVRIQLELRLQELKGVTNGAALPTTRPTNL